MLLEQEENRGCWWQGPGEPLVGANHVLWVWMLRRKGAGMAAELHRSSSMGTAGPRLVLLVSESPQELKAMVQRQLAFMAGRSMLAVLYAVLSWQLEAGARRANHPMHHLASSGPEPVAS